MPYIQCEPQHKIVTGNTWYTCSECNRRMLLEDAIKHSKKTSHDGFEHSWDSSQQLDLPIVEST